MNQTPNPYRSVRCTHCGTWCKAKDISCGMCGHPPLHAVGQGPRPKPKRKRIA